MVPIESVLATASPGNGGTVAVDLIVKGGALGLALLLTWMSYQLFHSLFTQPGRPDLRKVALAVFFVFGTFGSLIGGALLHGKLSNPKVEVVLLVSPELDRNEDLPEVQAASVRRDEGRKYRVEVRGGELVTIEVTRLLNRAREAARLQEIVSQYERTRAAASPEIGAEDAL